MTPTKADPLYARMVHAFGEKRVDAEIKSLMSTSGKRDPLRWLTDEARDELLLWLISDFKFTRKLNAENRRRRREKVIA